MSKSMTSCSNLCLYHLYFSINIVLFFIVLCVTFLIFWQLRNLWVKFCLSFFIQLNFCLSAYKFGCFKTNWTDMKLVSKPYRAIRRVGVCGCLCKSSSNTCWKNNFLQVFWLNLKRTKRTKIHVYNTWAAACTLCLYQPVTYPEFFWDTKFSRGFRSGCEMVKTQMKCTLDSLKVIVVLRLKINLTFCFNTKSSLFGVLICHVLIWLSDMTNIDRYSFV